MCLHLSLSLLVLLVLVANNVQFSPSSNSSASIAEFLYRCSNLHGANELHGERLLRRSELRKERPGEL